MINSKERIESLNKFGKNVIQFFQENKLHITDTLNIKMENRQGLTIDAEHLCNGQKMIKLFIL